MLYSLHSALSDLAKDMYLAERLLEWDKERRVSGTVPTVPHL
jgi:hypothetical protein